jgi:FkbM family methyltransferase
MTQIQLLPTQAWTFARLPGLLAQLHINPGVITHIGAHHGEEVAIYRACGFHHIRLVEPDPRSVAILRENFGTGADVTIIPAAAAVDAGTVHLHYAERTVWSALAPHPTADGQGVTVAAKTMDELQGEANVLVLDTQGSELELLHHAALASLDLVIIETTRRVGDGAALYDDAVAYMDAQGWTVAEEWIHDGSGYTDTVFVPR